MEIKKKSLSHAMRDTIQQMMDDKREISSYIKEHGTLSGYSGRVKFVKPF